MAFQLQSRIRPFVGEPDTAWTVDDTCHVRRKTWNLDLNNSSSHAGERQYRVVHVSHKALVTACKGVA